MAAQVPSNGINLDKGLSFPATVAAQSGANVLDEYEEGSFTTVLRDATSGGNTASIGNATSQYVRVGRLVFFSINLFNINKSGMTSSNALYLTGLPFAAADSSNAGMYSRYCNVVESDEINFTSYVTFDVPGGFSRGDFHDNRDSEIDQTLTVAAIDTASDSDIIINGFYMMNT